MTFIVYGAVNTHMAGFTDIAACTVSTHAAYLTVYGIIFYKAGITAFTSGMIFQMAEQAAVITAVAALLTAVKTAVTEQASFVCGTCTAVGTVLTVFDAAIYTHFTFVTPEWSAFAAVVTEWT